jgi:hypothetical protein
VVFHPPLPAPAAGGAAGEDELLAGVAAFFDAHVRAHPGTLRLAKLRELALAEPLAVLASGASAAAS